MPQYPKLVKCPNCGNVKSIRGNTTNANCPKCHKQFVAAENIYDESGGAATAESPHLSVPSSGTDPDASKQAAPPQPPPVQTLNISGSEEKETRCPGCGGRNLNTLVYYNANVAAVEESIMELYEMVCVECGGLF